MVFIKATGDFPFALFPVDHQETRLYITYLCFLLLLLGGGSEPCPVVFKLAPSFAYMLEGLHVVLGIDLESVAFRPLIPIQFPWPQYFSTFKFFMNLLFT